MAAGQIFFTLGDAKDTFNTWVAKNGYDNRRVFIAGWMALSRLTHDQRIELFKETDDWEERGFPMKGESTAETPKRPPGTTTTSPDALIRTRGARSAAKTQRSADRS